MTDTNPRTEGDDPHPDPSPGGGRISTATVQTIIQAAASQLGVAGIDNPSLDARLLVAHALGCDRLALVMEAQRELTSDEATQIAALIARRVAREPVGRILGAREFWGLRFGLNEATLEPRPDSETVIEAALKLCAGHPPRAVLDLGTGSGCLLLALLHEWQGATGLGVDQAARALEQAAANAAVLGSAARARFQVGDWLSGIEGRFDLVVSNPPYIETAIIAGLMPEVRDHDPVLALDGGADGLEPYRTIIAGLRAVMNNGGRVIFEVGTGQAAAVAAMLVAAGFGAVATHHDLGNIERCVSALLEIG